MSRIAAFPWAPPDAVQQSSPKNPDALVRAPRNANTRFEVPSRWEAFFIDNPVSERSSGFFSTHPCIKARIEALRRNAGADTLIDQLVDQQAMRRCA